jgi:hypothetical protein
MGFSLKNIGSRIWDQVNPLDNGRSWQTRTPTYTGSAASQIRDVFDANSAQDQRRRVQQTPIPYRVPQNYREEQIMKGNLRPYENFGEQVFGNTSKFLNTAEYGRNALEETVRGQIADWTGNDSALNSSLDRQAQIRKKWADPRSGVLGAGTIFNSDKEMMDLGNAEIAKRVAGNTLGTASEIIPFAKVTRPVTIAGKGAQVLWKGGKPVTSSAILAASAAERGASGVLPRVGMNAAIDSTTGAAESIARQYAQTGKVDPTQVFADTAANTLMGQTQVAGGELWKAGKRNYTPLDISGSVPNSTNPDVPMQEATDAAKKIVDGKAVDKPKVAIKQADVETKAPKEPKVQPEVVEGDVVEAAKNSIVTKFMKNFVDEDAYIIKQLRQVEKNTGMDGLVRKFLYNSNMQRGSNTVANVMLQTSENFDNALKGLDADSYVRFGDYANARTELATAKSRGAKWKTSKSVADLNKIVKEGEAEFGDRFTSLNGHYKDLVNVLEDSGVISPKKAAQFRANNDYIRIQRDMEDLIQSQYGTSNAYGIGSTVSAKNRKGSNRDILPPGETAAHYTQQIMRESRKNITANQIIDNLEPYGLARRVSSQKASTKNTITLFKNGTKQYYEVAPDMKIAMDRVNPYQMNLALKIASLPGRTLRAGTTGLNPVFIARNLVRDQAGSAINSKSTLRTHNPKVIIEGLLNAAGDSVGMNNSAIYQDFLRHYGDITSYDLTRNTTDATALVDRARGGVGTKVVQGIKSPIRSLENFASITEKSTRFQNYIGTYRKAIDDGLDVHEAHVRAAEAAWQNSVDFARAGTVGRFINTIIPYWNPATQGTRQMARTLKNHPIKSPIVATTVVGIPMIASTAMQMSEEDPEKKAIYDNISDFEKDNNLIWVFGNGQDDQGNYTEVLKVPLPQGWKDLFRPITRAMEDYKTQKPVEGAALAQDLLQTILGPIQIGSKSQAIGSVTPQIVKPVVQSALNKDLYTGKSIVPDYMNEQTDANGNPIPENKKAFDTSSGTTKLIGDKFSKSPIKVEKAIKDIFGEVGLEGLNFSDNIIAKTKGDKWATPQNESDFNIGGRSVKASFEKSFGTASPVINTKKSDGAIYFENLKNWKKELGFTPNDEAAYNALHPANKNFTGEKIYEADAVYNPAARLDAYNRFPKTLELDKKLNEDNVKKGKPSNPLMELEEWQLKKVLEKENLPPGAEDPELSKLYDQEWFDDYRNKKTLYFSKLKAIATKENKPFGNNDNPYPEAGADLDKVMENYNKLPKGTGARSTWIKSNPGLYKRMTDYYAAVDNWQNIQRGKRGLDSTEGEVGKQAGYGDDNGYKNYGYSRGGGGGGAKEQYESPSKYRVSISTSTPKSGKAKAAPKVAGSAKKSNISKPRVTIKKSKV